MTGKSSGCSRWLLPPVWLFVPTAHLGPVPSKHTLMYSPVNVFILAGIR